MSSLPNIPDIIVNVPQRPVDPMASTLRELGAVEVARKAADTDPDLPPFHQQLDDPQDFASRLESVTVREVMRDVPSVRVGTPLTSLAARFGRGRRGVVAIVDRESRPLGVVTPSTLIAAVSRHDVASLGGLDVLAASSPAGAMLYDDANLAAAARLLASSRTEFILIVSHAGRLQGVVSSHDVVGSLVEPAG